MWSWIFDWVPQRMRELIKKKELMRITREILLKEDERGKEIIECTKER